jgi:hypothetical protein
MQGIIMSTLYSATKSVLALFVTVALLGCMEKSVTEVTTPSKSVQATKTTKPGAAIKLISSSLISINANELAHTNIVLEAMELHGELTVNFSPSQGLNLASTSTPQTIKFDSSAPIKIPVSLVATANGRYYLNMHISLNNVDAISVRNLAVIVQVGPLAEKAVKLQKTVGENIIVLPAQETISSQ